MFTANGYYGLLKSNYLFSDIAKKVAAYSQAHPEAQLIRMGIGDVTQPLVPAVIKALHTAVDDMSRMETFHGYGPDYGYDWLRSAIVSRDYASRGIHLDVDEVILSDGAKCDVCNIQ